MKWQSLSNLNTIFLFIEDIILSFTCYEKQDFSSVLALICDYVFGPSFFTTLDI